MPIDDTAQYYLDRCRSAMVMSEAASDPAVRKIHLELARRYADRANLPLVTEAILPAATVRARLTIALKSGRSGASYD